MMQQRYVSMSGILLLCLLMGLSGCSSPGGAPTEPAGIGVPSPTAGVTDPSDPTKESTPAPDLTSCDFYADSIDDPELRILEADGTPFVIMMECAGDIDWYKIQLSQAPIKLSIELTDIANKSDFDLLLLDSHGNSIDGGRSSQSGNVDESLTVTAKTEVLFLQIYSYTGYGTATITIDTTTPTGGTVPEPEPEVTPESESGEEPEEEEPGFEHLTYQEILSNELWFYPQGNMSKLLERSVETVAEESITCYLSDGELTGTFTIGNYAHVERNLIEAIDYVDGWALAVFNGSKEVLDKLTLTIRVNFFSAGLELDITAPPEMTFDGTNYIASRTQNDVYYITQSYGDLQGSSSQDIQVSSGVVGELSESLSVMFQQEAEVEWSFEGTSGIRCSATQFGTPITDFEFGNWGVE